MTIKNRRLVIESNFIEEGTKHNLSLNEFLLLVYFDNSFDLVFDVKKIHEFLPIKEDDILEAYSNLLAKNIIKIETFKNENDKISDRVSLEPFYQNMILATKKEEKKAERKDIFSIFEAEFGRTLSRTDYEIINAWMEKGYHEELIIAALKEASYNGVKNLKYIDKILYEWHKKGFVVPNDIVNHLKNNDGDIPKYETSVLNFDWLNESN